MPQEFRFLGGTCALACPPSADRSNFRSRATIRVRWHSGGRSRRSRPGEAATASWRWASQSSPARIASMLSARPFVTGILGELPGAERPLRLTAQQASSLWQGLAFLDELPQCPVLARLVSRFPVTVCQKIHVISMPPPVFLTLLMRGTASGQKQFSFRCCQ